MQHLFKNTCKWGRGGNKTGSVTFVRSFTRSKQFFLNFEGPHYQGALWKILKYQIWSKVYEGRWVWIWMDRKSRVLAVLQQWRTVAIFPHAQGHHPPACSEKFRNLEMQTGKPKKTWFYNHALSVFFLSLSDTQLFMKSFLRTLIIHRRSSRNLTSSKWIQTWQELRT